jgi:hypothetical protein
MFRSRELDPEPDPTGNGVDGHLVDDALRSCGDFLRRQVEPATPGDALHWAGGKTVASLVQRELAEGLRVLSAFFVL